MVNKVTIGSPGSLARDIVPSDFAVGWKVAGSPNDAASLDTYEDLIRLRLRTILTEIILHDAPTGLQLDDIVIVNNTTVRLEYTVGGQAAHLEVDLAVLFRTADPAIIGPASVVGTDPTIPHGDHGHRLPSRASGETPVVNLDQIATSTLGGRGTRLGFNSVTGLPEYQQPSHIGILSDDDPEPVGGPTAPTPGDAATASRQNHGHDIDVRSVGLPELKAASTPADYGKSVGYDPNTGEPTTLDPPGSTFLDQTDTPMAYGTAGMATVINAAADGLEFGGPYMPISTPADPSSVRATDAFDMFLEVRWNAVAGAEAYEWQRKPSTEANWPTGNGTRTTGLSTRNTSPLANASYDFRVRAVSIGGLIRGGWTELLNIPIIPTPTPATSTSNVLSRVRSQTLRFSWDNLSVNNGGSGSARVVKSPSYEYQQREQGQTLWEQFIGTSSSISATISGLTNGEELEMRVRGVVLRSDGTNSRVDGDWSAASNAERPVKDRVTLNFGFSATRTGVILSQRTVEVPITGGITFEITNSANPVASGQFYVLDVARGDEYDHDYNVSSLETRPLPTDITAGSTYMAEAEPNSGPRRYSVGPAATNNQTQTWYIEVT